MILDLTLTTADWDDLGRLKLHDLGRQSRDSRVAAVRRVCIICVYSVLITVDTMTVVYSVYHCPVLLTVVNVTDSAVRGASTRRLRIVPRRARRSGVST